MGDGEFSNVGLQNGFDLVVTPDARFVRLLRRDLRRTSRTFAFAGLLMSITSLGTFMAEGAWFLAGLVGLPFGVIWCFAGLINSLLHLRRNPEMLAPLRYVFTADAIEWHTVHTSLRLPWTAIKHVSRSREAYRVDCADRNEPRYLCRTTLTSTQDAQLAAYLDERLAARLAVKTSVQPMPPTGGSQ
ncbi:hypothetical protein [Micromonospora purpureochromogenes]|uniref:PH domain-containing protein n=1 Tax=Micromonospora purpureochromogenes TaxID=47872 RepID=A0ABX2RPJ3_9ACTN|nr:hypothetical protein [Micromonospora purpureochromogenes]NYF57953.1 hypothetical protein [Micromonospora purpureochromogenes]